jgi:hypothetical protein
LLGSIFLDFHLPNATSWFYASLLIVLALFFRFSRPVSLRNWDLLLLFLLVPALLYLREAQETRRIAEAAVRIEVAGRTAQAVSLLAIPGGGLDAGAALAGVGQVGADAALVRAERAVWGAYLWLLLASGYFLIRCLLDVDLTRRPAFQPNLSLGGMAWLGLTMLVVLSLKTLIPPAEPVPESTSTSLVLERAATLLWMRDAFAIVCHVLVVAGLVWIGVRHFQNPAAGVGAALLYLLLPYTAYHVRELHHVFPAALLVGAVAAYRRPTVAGLLLGLAAGAVFFPLLLFPLWFSFYRRRGALRFTGAFTAMLAAVGACLWLDGSLRPYLHEAMSLPDWRAWDFSARPTAEGLWTGLDLHYAYRVPLFIAYLSLVIATAFWPAVKNLGHLIALSAALIIGVQFWYADAGGIYVLWYLPLLVLLALRPNLADRQPPAIDPATDRLHRVWRWAKQRLLPAVPEPVGSTGRR